MSSWKPVIKVENRWSALFMILVTVAQFSFNWFNITPAFSRLSVDMGLSFSNIGLLVGAFLVGYGIFHIPTGILTTRYGMHAGLLIGVTVQAIGVLLSAAAPDFTWLIVARIICGIGGSICIGTAVGLVGVWFAGREVGLATAMITGVAFTLGAMVAIYGWISVTAAFGWRIAIFIGGAVAMLNILLLVCVNLTPRTGERAEAAAGGHAELRGLITVFKSRNIWLWGLANFGAYGSYGAAAQLLPGYAERSLGASPEQAGFISLLLLITGIPASFLAGWYLDFRLPPRLYFIGTAILCSLCFIAIPHLTVTYLSLLAALLGFMLIATNAFWFSIPALYPNEVPVEDIPTAIGLMLTFGAVSGFVTPLIFTTAVEAFGFNTAWAIVGGGVALFSLLCLATSPMQHRVAAHPPARGPSRA